MFIAYNTIEAKIRNKYYKKTYQEPEWRICMHRLGPMSVPDVVVILDGISDIGCYIKIIKNIQGTQDVSSLESLPIMAIFWPCTSICLHKVLILVIIVNKKNRKTYLELKMHCVSSPYLLQPISGPATSICLHEV